MIRKGKCPTYEVCLLQIVADLLELGIEIIVGDFTHCKFDCT